MTQEEKAKRYDEAFEVAQRFYNNSVAVTKKGIEDIFPEFKENEENEDERIRKELISLFQDCIDGVNHRYTGSDSKRWLAWLEKQGEHANFRNKIQIGDKVTRNEDGVLVNLSQLKRVAKPAEEYNITGIGSKNAQGKLGEMIKKLKPVNEVLEQGFAWSEEDEKQARQIERIVHDDGCTQKLQKQIADWFKSLKERCNWKPSDEQIEILDMVLTNESMDDNIARILRELREQLKKLREE